MTDENEIHFEGKIHQNVVLRAGDTGRVLLVRDPRDEKWELPGGRLNLGETPKEGVLRELREELNIEVELGDIIHSQLLLHEASGRTNFLQLYRADIVSESILTTPNPEEVAEIQWVDQETYKSLLLFTDTRESLEEYFNRV